YLVDCRPYAGTSPEPLDGPGAASAAETPAAVEVPPEDPLPTYLERIKQGEEQLVPLAKLGLPRFLKPHNYIWPFLVLAMGAVYPLSTVIGWPYASILCGVVAIGLGVAVRIWLIKVARRQVARLYHSFCQIL